MKPFSKKIEQMAESETVAITTKAQALRCQGKDIISLSVGEPDFATPRNIQDAAIDAIQKGFTKYAPAAGYPSLISAIEKKFERDNKIKYQPNQIVISNGAKQSIFNTVMTLLNPGDHAVILAPFWVTYVELVKLAGAKPVIVEGLPEEGFKIPVSRIQKAITIKTKLLILNSPCNPTGAIFSKEELQKLAALIAKKNIYVISDEVYEKIIYDDAEHVSLAALGKEAYDRTITVNGVSKAYAMTGWRIGYLGAHEKIAKQITKFQAQITHHPSTISMKAAESALLGPQESIIKMRQEFDNRRKYMMQRLSQIPEILYVMPKGAFYFFSDVSKYYGRTYHGKAIKGSVDLANFFLNEMGVAVVPGIAFGAEECIRLSFATDMANLEKAMDRIEKGFKSLTINKL